MPVIRLGFAWWHHKYSAKFDWAKLYTQKVSKIHKIEEDHQESYTTNYCLYCITDDDFLPAKSQIYGKRVKGMMDM